MEISEAAEMLKIGVFSAEKRQPDMFVAQTTEGIFTILNTPGDTSKRLIIGPPLEVQVAEESDRDPVQESIEAIRRAGGLTGRSREEEVDPIVFFPTVNPVGPYPSDEDSSDVIPVYGPDPKDNQPDVSQTEPVETDEQRRQRKNARGKINNKRRERRRRLS